MRRTLAAVCILLVLLPGCAHRKMQPNTETVFTMSTVAELTAYGENSENGLDAAKAILTRCEALFSVTREGSEVSRINNAGNAGDIDPDTMELISLALGLCKQTCGKLDITIYPVVRAWGFTTDESKRVPEPEELAGLLENVDYRRVSVEADTVTVPEGVQIDLGAVAKGYIGDRAIGAMRGAGVSSAIISLGGNVQTLGQKPDGTDWRVAVRNPQNPETYIGIASIGEGAVVTSGSYERFFVENGVTYHHIIDPFTGYPADSGLISVTVIAEGGRCGLLADALSTALYVMGMDEALEFWELSGGEIDGVRFGLVLVSDSGEITVTPGTSFTLNEN